MKFSWNVKKSHLNLIVIAYLVLGTMFAVYAYHSGGPASYFGHSGEEIEVTLPNGTSMTINEYIQNGLIANLKCTQATRTQNNAINVLSGDASAVTNVGTGPNQLWGIKCINGYQKTGCHVATNNTGNGNPNDNDIWPSNDSCLTDNEEYNSFGVVSAICCKGESSTGQGSSSGGGTTTITGVLDCTQVKSGYNLYRSSASCAAGYSLTGGACQVQLPSSGYITSLDGSTSGSTYSCDLEEQNSNVRAIAFCCRIVAP